MLDLYSKTQLNRIVVCSRRKDMPLRLSLGLPRLYRTSAMRSRGKAARFVSWSCLRARLLTESVQAGAYPVDSYTSETMASAFSQILADFPTSQGYSLRVALWNTAGHFVWKSFLDVTDDDVKAVLQQDVEAGFAFSRHALKAFKENELDENGKRGSLLFTGATASLRGNTMTSAFAAGRFALRALSQSLAKEFSKLNIHVRLDLPSLASGRF